MGCWRAGLLWLLWPALLGRADLVLNVSESAAPGLRLGFVADPPPANPHKVNFYVVFPDEQSRADKVGVCAGLARPGRRR